jgi:hypothetical protein
MPRLSDAQIADYLRLHPLRNLGAPLTIRPLEADSGMARFQVSGAQGACVLTCYEPSEVETARREVAGLTLGGLLGMAPALLQHDEAGGALGGPVVVVAEPVGTALGHQRLSTEDAHDWLFLLLTLHHLPAASVTIAWAGSADAESWWQRAQAAWKACLADYAGSQYQPLRDALSQLHAIVGVHVEVNRGLWQDLPRRPCHGNPVPAHVVRTSAGMQLIEWSGFGLGDPAMEVGRAGALAALSGELSAGQYVQFIADYLAGMRDTGDTTLEERVRVFASILPLGFAFTVLHHLAQLNPGGRDYAPTVEQVARALVWIQDTLGVEVGKAEDLLAPLRVPA